MTKMTMHEELDMLRKEVEGLKKQKKTREDKASADLKLKEQKDSDIEKALLKRLKDKYE